MLQKELEAESDVLINMRVAKLEGLDVTNNEFYAPAAWFVKNGWGNKFDPCKECPYTKNSAPGYFGGHKMQDY